ncbi:hypothetical protein L3X38_015590 [Prunus dulcis]|uniref:RNase H type-1 domain-containing protein n=1 Tax=Prunus dulcis TaxID=3755 RepID=A0AAD4Z8Z2_PRUDU|nr:hypothetical protein L3X38_015590 [Prunus dulcis]
MVGNERVVLAGVGVALCDSRDNLVFEVWKPLIGKWMSKNGALLKALIEGLNAGLALDLTRITFFLFVLNPRILDVLVTVLRSIYTHE